MLDFIRNWIISVTAVSCVAAAVMAVVPKGTARRAARVVLGLALIAALLGPAASLDVEELAEDAEGKWELDVTEFAETNARLTEEIIADECEAYILDKAAALGVACLPEVRCSADENGLCLPVSVALHAEYSAALSGVIETDLGVGRENQTWG